MVSWGISQDQMLPAQHALRESHWYLAVIQWPMPRGERCNIYTTFPAEVQGITPAGGKPTGPWPGGTPSSIPPMAANAWSQEPAPRLARQSRPGRVDYIRVPVRPVGPIQTRAIFAWASILDFPCFMSTIHSVSALEILDSRGRPTVRATCRLEGGATASASVPSGASTGAAEAVELRDGDPARYAGLGCLQAVANVNGPINRGLRGTPLADQAELDRGLLELDGTPNKARLGANALLAVSLAFARAQAVESGRPLYAHFAALWGQAITRLPRMTINLFSGGKHAGGQVPIQDVLIVPASPQHYRGPGDGQRRVSGGRAAGRAEVRHALAHRRRGRVGPAGRRARSNSSTTPCRPSATPGSSRAATCAWPWMWPPATSGATAAIGSTPGGR